MSPTPSCRGNTMDFSNREFSNCQVNFPSLPKLILYRATTIVLVGQRGNGADGLSFSLCPSTWIVTCAVPRPRFVSSLSAWQPEPTRRSQQNDTYSEIYRSPRREPETFHVSFAPPLLSNDVSGRSVSCSTGPVRWSYPGRADA